MTEAETPVAFPEPAPDPNCRSCNALRVQAVHLKQEAERHKGYAEGSSMRMAQLETDIIAAHGVTLTSREHETIVKLQRADLVQRLNIDANEKEISRLRQEIDRLIKLCREHDISTVKPGVPDASPTISPGALLGWGAMTGNSGVGN